MTKNPEKQIRITLVRSPISRPARHRAVLAGLGLTRPNKTVLRPDTPQIRGMIDKVAHLVAVEQA